MKQFEDTSQYGEGKFLVEWFDAPSHAPTYQTLVDIGAKTKHFSNSYPLIKHRGWSAVLVEPHPKNFAQLQKDFAFANSRVRCANVAVGDPPAPQAGSGPAIAPFYLHDTPGHSSLVFKIVDGSLNEVNRGVKSIGRPIDMTVIRIRELFDRFDLPADIDLLCVDAEGSDAVILHDMMANTDIRPSVIVWEPYTPKGINREVSDKCRNELEANGYEQYALTIGNEIMVLS